MTPLNIITEFLQSIPPRMRKAMLLVFALAVVATQIAEAFEYDLHTGIYRTLALIGGYLGIQSVANVATAPKGELTEKPDDDVDSGLAVDEADGWHPEA